MINLTTKTYNISIVVHGSQIRHLSRDLSGKQCRDRIPEIRNRHRPCTIEQLFVRMHAQSCVNGSVEVGNGDGGLDDFLTQFIGHAIGAAVFQAATGQ